MALNITVNSARYSTQPFPVTLKAADDPGPGVGTGYTADVILTWDTASCSYAGQANPRPDYIDAGVGKIVWLAVDVPAAGDVDLTVNLSCAAGMSGHSATLTVTASDPAAGVSSMDSLTRNCP